ncbi:hypothetical protein BDZ91DRAFT_306160 [Kalaharituber pfeilii]|nr:hypothetical protein BDZ91DRAFT_306160 [Kalaharituber pfeilii]
MSSTISSLMILRRRLGTLPPAYYYKLFRAIVEPHVIYAAEACAGTLKRYGCYTVAVYTSCIRLTEVTFTAGAFMQPWSATYVMEVADIEASVSTIRDECGGG